MVRSYVVTSELACRNGWLGMYCYLGSTQLKNSTVYKSTKCKTRVWMTDNSQKNTALNPGTQSCSRDSLRRKYRTGCLLPWSKVNCMAPKVRFTLVALLWLVLREKKISREARLLSPQLSTPSCKPWIVRQARINRLIPSFPTGDENKMEW